MDMEAKQETNLDFDTSKCETPEMTINRLHEENAKLKQELERATMRIYKLMSHITTITNIVTLVDEKTQNY